MRLKTLKKLQTKIYNTETNEVSHNLITWYQLSYITTELDTYKKYIVKEYQEQYLLFNHMLHDELAIYGDYQFSIKTEFAKCLIDTVLKMIKNKDEVELVRTYIN